jgi:DNA sulfur modification protein DndB
MTNKTFIPAFRALVGDWQYYICIMKYAEVARQVGFAYELGGNSDLNTMIQRGLGTRTDAIKDYLLKSEHRFLGALIVAAWGGEPTYVEVSMEDPDGLLAGMDRQFGVLIFDGTQQYFALDGQHRLKSIKEAIKARPELGKEDICVIMVSHFDTEEGKIRTRRLFTNINRNAKATTSAENIVLDEDDGAAILTRRLLTEHPFWSRDGVVKVFTRNGEDGELKLAAANVSQSDKKAVTTIANLYDVVRALSFDLHPSMKQPQARPSDEVLEQAYAIISKRLDDVLGSAGDLRAKIESGVSAKELRAPKSKEAEGSAFMRPVVQKAVARVVSEIASQGALEWTEIISRLSAMSWRIGDGPWLAVFNPASRKMIGAKENAELLRDLLYVHLAAPTKQAITRARKQYKELRGSPYPVSEEALQEHLTPHTEVRIDIPALVSEDPVEQAESSSPSDS